MARTQTFRTQSFDARPRLRPWLAQTLALGLLAVVPLAAHAAGLGAGPDKPPVTVAPTPRPVAPRPSTPAPSPPRVSPPPVSRPTPRVTVTPRPSVKPAVRTPTVKKPVKKPVVKKPVVKKPTVSTPPLVTVPRGVTTTQASLPTATTAGGPDATPPAAIAPVGSGGSAPAVLATILLTLATLLAGGLALLPRVPAARSALTKDRLLVLDRHRYELTALAAVGGLTLLVLLAI